MLLNLIPTRHCVYAALPVGRASTITTATTAPTRVGGTHSNSLRHNASCFYNWITSFGHSANCVSYVRLLTRLGGASSWRRRSRTGSPAMDRQTSRQESSHVHVRIIRYPLGIDDFMLSMVHWIKLGEWIKVELRLRPETSDCPKKQCSDSPRAWKAATRVSP